jgi:hypothetical protein
VLCIAERLGRDAIGMAGGSDITETASEWIRLFTERPAGIGGGSILLLGLDDKAERLITSRAPAEGTGCIYRSSSDGEDWPAEWSVCLRAGSGGGNDGRAAPYSSSSDFSRVGETLEAADGARL